MKQDKLKIAILSPPSLPIPPFRGYGGTQRGIYDFLKEMNKKGHRLHLFAPGDSDVSGLENVVLHSIIDKSLWIPDNNLPIETKLEQTAMHDNFSIERLYEIDEKEGIDIINLRRDNPYLIQEVVKQFGSERVVYSLHNLKNPEIIDMIKELGIVTIAHCRNHKEQHENLPNIRVIVYGIDTHAYPFSKEILSQTEEDPQLDILRHLKDRNKDYLITLGNICKEKGQKTSIRLAIESGNALIIAGEPQARTSNEKILYFENEVKPYIDNENIFYFGNANEEQKKLLLKYAKGFLFPSGYEDRRWEEPFGRAPVEAMACGTPVVAYRKGSMKELIFDSFNGYLFDSFSEAVKKIHSLDRINREYCRHVAETKFDCRRVASEYEELFYSIKEKLKA